MTPPSDGNSGEGKLLFMLEQLQGLRDEMTAQHQRLRSDVNAGFQGTTHEVQALRNDLTTMRIDVNTLRTVREIEQQYSTRRATWAGLLAGFLFSVLMKLGDVLWHR